MKKLVLSKETIRQLNVAAIRAGRIGPMPTKPQPPNPTDNTFCVWNCTGTSWHC